LRNSRRLMPPSRIRQQKMARAKATTMPTRKNKAPRRRAGEARRERPLRVRTSPGSHQALNPASSNSSGVLTIDVLDIPTL
jgi:hypothetical protein